MYDELVKDLRICAEGEHCNKCGKWEVKQNGGRNACEYAICTEAADAIEELICEVADEHNARLDAEEKQRWIPVTERLPEERKDVLVALRRGEIAVDYYQPNRWGYSDVTHWMPLPEPPKEAYDEN